MSVYLLNCTVCQEQICRSQDWLKHLTRGRHQHLARKEWNTEYNGRECCLVVFTTYSLTREGADKVIEYFTDETTFVTDFVWWEDRSRIVIVQFESRAKVEDVLNAVDASSELQIDNERVQVKGAFDLLDLEWRAVLPGDNEKPTSREAQSCLETMKRKRESSEFSYESKRQKVNPWASNDDTLTPPSHLPRNHDASIIREPVHKLPASIQPCSPDSLRHQFWLIRQSTVISNAEYNECLRIVDSLNKLFQESYSSDRVVMFRNWYLQLRHPTKTPDEEHLLIFAYNDWSPPEFPYSHSWLSDKSIFRVLTGPKAQDFEFVSEKSRFGHQVKYKSSAIPIHLCLHMQDI